MQLTMQVQADSLEIREGGRMRTTSKLETKGPETHLRSLGCAELDASKEMWQLVRG